MKFRQQFQPITVGQRQIEQDQVERALADSRQPMIGGGRRFYRVTFQFEQSFQRFANGGFVVDNQDGTRGRRRFAQSAARNRCQFRH